MQSVTQFIQSTFTLGRAAVGTVASTSSAAVGTIAAATDGPHWLQLCAWGGAAVAGLLTGLGVAVKIWLDVSRYRRER
jgi:hypothetical protein